jgi:hypothetical protein
MPQLEVIHPRRIQHLSLSPKSRAEAWKPTIAPSR